MSATMEIQLANGRSLFIGSQPTADPAAGLGLSQLSEISLRSAVPQASASQFENALGSLGDLVGVLQRQVAGLLERPSKVEIEFGATLTGQCNLWVVSGQGSAEFKVTLTWDKDPSPSALPAASSPAPPATETP